jgi:hypothetical protein
MDAKDLRIPLNLAEYHSAAEEEIPLDFALSDSERQSFPNLLSIADLALYASLSGASNLYTVTVFAKGTVTLRDAHDGKERTVPIDDSVDAAILPNDEENSDLLPDPDGTYDLRSTILALLFDAIPKNYSEVPLRRIETDDYVLMSEEEREREKNAQSNPFSALDGADLPSAPAQKKKAAPKKNAAAKKKTSVKKTVRK